MKCPKCQGLVMGIGGCQGDEVFKCIDCKTIFTIWGDYEDWGEENEM